MTDQVFRKKLCYGAQLVTIISPTPKSFTERISKLDGAMYIDFEIEKQKWFCVTNAPNVIFVSEQNENNSQKPNKPNKTLKLIKQIDPSFFWIRREEKPCEFRVIAKHDFSLILRCKVTQNNKCFRIPERILFRTTKGTISTGDVYSLIKNAFVNKQKVHDCYTFICEEYGYLNGLMWLSTVEKTQMDDRIPLPKKNYMLTSISLEPIPYQSIQLNLPIEFSGLREIPLSWCSKGKSGVVSNQKQTPFGKLPDDILIKLIDMMCTLTDVSRMVIYYDHQLMDVFRFLCKRTHLLLKSITKKCTGITDRGYCHMLIPSRCDTTLCKCCSHNMRDLHFSLREKKCAHCIKELTVDECAVLKEHVFRSFIWCKHCSENGFPAIFQ